MAKLGLGSQSEVAQLLSQAKNLHSRILFVLMAFAVYRLGTHVPLPGINLTALASYQNNLSKGLFGMFNMFSGGAFKRMAIFALNIVPFITASIIIQLLAAAYPTLKELQKEGEMGRRKLNQYTRYLTVALAFVQGFGLATGLESQTATVAGEVLRLVPDPGLFFRLETALTITAGTMFLMWLGEQINTRGIGNGSSLIIFAGIVAGLPGALVNLFQLAKSGSLSGLVVLALLLGAIGVILFIVFMETAVRRIAIQYPKRQGMGAMSADANHLPLKVNMGGVMAPIFASTVLMIPVTVASYFPNAGWARFTSAWFSPGHSLYVVVFVTMIVFFSFFWVANVAFKADDTADNLKKSGAFIPGIRPGNSTAEYLDKVATRITAIGAAYMALVCVVPDFLHRDNLVPFYIGGTSLLIIVSVTIDTVARIQSALIAQKYETLLKRASKLGAGGNLFAASRRR